MSNALRGDKGQGMAAQTETDLTNGPNYPHSAGSSTDGETSGVGSRYMASIRERENKSNPRNQGPTRGGSVVAAHALPMASKAGRNTGKI
jgi:hypothetical protein